MALTTMYEGMNNSPQTDITAAITASDTVIPVSSVSVFPAAPNLATLGTDENAEVIRYNGISGSTLTGCERGFGGSTASPWTTGTVISRQITKYDLDTLRGNVLDLESRKLEAMDTVPTAGSTKPVQSNGIAAAFSSVNTAMGLKAPLASPALTGTPTAPTAPVGTNTTQLATCEFVHLNGVYRGIGSISAGQSATFNNEKITADMHLISCTFGTPSSVTSDVTITTGAGYITFSGTSTTTFTAITTVEFYLVDPTSLTLS